MKEKPELVTVLHDVAETLRVLGARIERLERLAEMHNDLLSGFTRLLYEEASKARAEAEADWTDWTHYSEGSPRSYRRVYHGRLLYLVPGFATDGEYTWHDATKEPIEVWGPYPSRAEAQRAAEEYAELLAKGGAAR